MSPTRPAVSDIRRRSVLVDRHLLDARGRPERSIHDVISALGLLHSTDPSTPYLSIHARTDATVGDVASALYDEPRSLLRHTTIRRTVFVMGHELVPFAHGAFNPPLVARLRAQLVKWIDASDDVDGPAPAFLDAAEQAVLSVLASDGPKTGAQLAKLVPALRVTVDPMPDATYSKPIRLTSKVLEVLAAEGRLARGRPTGDDLTSGAWTWAAGHDWWPHGVGDLDADVALTGLLERYLGACGPATVTDMAWWTGLTKTAVKRALGRLRTVEVDLDDSESGWLLPGDVETVLAANEPADAIALLPGLDATTMAWKQRHWYVDDSKDLGIFDRNGNSGPTIWLGGSVIGSWTQRASGEVATELFVDVGDEVRSAVGEEADRIAAWLGDVRVKWRYPTPITKRLAS